MTYALLIYRAALESGQIPELDASRGLSNHRALQAEAAARGHLQAVARLGNPNSARIVKARSTGHDVSDGPFIESKEWLVGFYLLDCDDEAQAVARAQQIAEPDHVIEVRPVDWRWRP
jgi:hypothetical protein